MIYVRTLFKNNMIICLLHLNYFLIKLGGFEEIKKVKEKISPSSPKQTCHESDQIALCTFIALLINCFKKTLLIIVDLGVSAK